LVRAVALYSVATVAVALGFVRSARRALGVVALAFVTLAFVTLAFVALAP